MGVYVFLVSMGGVNHSSLVWETENWDNKIVDCVWFVCLFLCICVCHPLSVFVVLVSMGDMSHSYLGWGTMIWQNMLVCCV